MMRLLKIYYLGMKSVQIDLPDKFVSWFLLNITIREDLVGITILNSFVKI